MAGITRYAHKQEALDGRIDEARHEFAALNAAEPKDFDRIDALEEEIDWSTRIFQDRQQSLTYVCETPVILEQRAFALGRAIAAPPAGVGAAATAAIGKTFASKEKAVRIRPERVLVSLASDGIGIPSMLGGVSWNNVPSRPAASDVARVRAAHAISDVLIVDDHPLMCDALAATLGYAFGLRKVRVASSLGAALANIREEGAPDAVVLDLNLPDAEGVEGVIALRRQSGRRAGHRDLGRSRPRHGFGGRSQSEQGDTSASCCRARRWSRPSAGCGPERPWCPRAAIARPTRPDDAAMLARSFASLTPQQMNILRLICQGRPNKIISYELSIAEATVKTHIAAIMAKINVSNRTQAALLASKARIFTR